MKKFIISIMFVTLLFLGLGSLVQNTGARYKSDDKALALIARARQAIGGDAAIAQIQSMRITGSTTRNIKADGVARSESGQTEIDLQLPDKLMKTITIGDNAGGKTELRTVKTQLDIVTTGAPEAGAMAIHRGEGSGRGVGAGGDIHIMIKKDDGTIQELTGDEAKAWVAAHHDVAGGGPEVKTFVIKTPDGAVQTVNAPEGTATGNMVFKRVDGNGTGEPMTFKVQSDNPGEPMAFKVENNNVILRHGGEARSNELLRLTLSLLLTAPQGTDVEYTYGGPATVDTTQCETVNASFAGQTYRLYLDQGSALPVAVSYKGMAMPKIVMFKHKEGEAGELQRAATAGDGGQDKVIVLKAAPEAGATGNYTFKRVEDAPAASVDYMVKFSDFRPVNGVELPYQWTQTGGDADEIFNVANYEINPANIAEKFQNQRVFLRTPMKTSDK